MRGYAAIGLDRPKNAINVGMAMRAAGVFGASLVVTSGRRFLPGGTDTMKAWRHTPLVRVDDLLAATPVGCLPVVVERSPRAVDLAGFTHPERAFYIFGPEDGAVRADILARCPLVVSIDAGSLNLAAAVNVVLYDRQTKAKFRASGRWPLRAVP